MVSKITNLKNAVLTLIALMYSSQLHAEVHPVIFKDDLDLYSKTYFGMNINEFKTKLSSSIVACQDAPRSNNFADIACKVAFKSNSYGMNEALVMFKKENLISILYKINNERYQIVITDLSNVYKDQPQIEKRDEKKGVFSSAVSNEYSIWAFKDYLMMVSKFDIQRYVASGPNFLYAVESTDASLMNNIRDEAKKKSKIEMQLKVANVDLNNLHQQSVNGNSQSNPNAHSEIKNEPEGRNVSTQNSETKKTAEVFGMSLGRNLQIPECNKQYGIYDISTKVVCFERAYGKEKLTSPVINETVRIAFPITESPSIVKNGVLLGMVIDGKLEGINFNTFGVKNADSVLLKLKEKYGEPQEFVPYKEENRLGQKFDAFTAIWRQENLEVYMQSILGSITSGLVSIDTLKAKEAKSEITKSLKKENRPL